MATSFPRDRLHPPFPKPLIRHGGFPDAREASVRHDLSHRGVDSRLPAGGRFVRPPPRHFGALARRFDLRGGTDRNEVLEVEFDADVSKGKLLSIVGVQQAKRMQGNNWSLAHVAGTDVRSAVFQFAVDNGLKVLTLRRGERDLAEVFKELTGTSTGRDVAPGRE